MDMLYSSSIEIENTEDLKKHNIREKVWSHIQQKNLANFPRYVYKRIPNFKGAEEASIKLADLDCFKDAKAVKVNLDKPQGHVRLLTLEADKTLYVPTPGLRTGLFNRMDSTSAGENTPEKRKMLSQNDGMKLFSKPLDLDEPVTVDLIVVGSVAVSKTGHRIGKGEGFVDLEYGMMRHMNYVTEKTIVITTVHDCQVFEELPKTMFESHDMPVDIIVTPTQVIEVTDKLSRPSGLLWKLLSRDKFFRVAILRKIFEKQTAAGEKIELMTDEPVPTEEELADYWLKVEEERKESRKNAKAEATQRGRGRGRRGSRGGRREGGYRGEGGEDEVEAIPEEGENGEVTRGRGRRGRGRGGMTGRRRGYHHLEPNFSIFLGNVPADSRTREIKEAVREAIDSKAKGVEIQRRASSGYAFLRFNSLSSDFADELVDSLQGMKLQERDIVVERARDRSPRPEDREEVSDRYAMSSSYGRGGPRRGRGGYRGRGGPRRGRGGRSRSENEHEGEPDAELQSGEPRAADGHANEDGEDTEAPKKNDRRRQVGEQSDEEYYD